MLEYVIYIISFFITIPIVATLLIYLISFKIHRKKLKAIHTAVNWTTVLYIAAVVLLLEIVAGRSFLGWLFVLFIGSLAVIIFYQWKNRTEIELRKAVKIIWRISFLVYLLLYVLLVLAGIIQRILS